MIFKSFNTDLSRTITQTTSLTNQIGILNTSFADMARAYNSSKNAGLSGLAGLKNSLANTSTEVITQTDYELLGKFNEALQEGTEKSIALRDHMGYASKGARELAMSADNAGVNLENLKVSTNNSVMAMVGARAAAMALNMALTMGLSIAIQGVVSAYDDWANAEEKAYEEAQKNAQEAKEKADETKKESETLEKLIEQYKKLAESENRNTPEVRAEILNIQTQIKDMVGKEAENLDLVNGKLEEEIAHLETIDEAMNARLSNSYKDSFTAATDELKRLLEKEYTFEPKVDFNVQDNPNQYKTKYAEVITETGYGDHQQYKLRFNTDDINKQVTGLNSLLEKLENASLNDTKLYTELSKIRDKISTAQTKQYSAAEQYLQSLTKQIAYDNKSSVTSLDTYKEYREELINTVKNDDTIKKALKDGVFDKSSITNLVDSYLSTIGSLSEYYNQWQVHQNSMNEIEARRTAEEAKAKIQQEFDSTPKLSFSELISFEDEDGHTFKDTVNEYVDKITDLKDTLSKIQSGDFDYQTDLFKLQDEYPELIGNTEDLDKAILGLIDTAKTDVISKFSTQFGRLETEEDKQKLQEFMEQVLKLSDVVGNTEFSIDIEAETQGMENFYTAVKESVSATGLSAQSIANLKERYKDLNREQIDKLFERTEHGIHLNADALRELESEYEKKVIKDYTKEITDLRNQYNDLTNQIDRCSDAAKRSELYKQRKDIEDQINVVSDLAAQYEGLTSAFNKWTEALNTDNQDSMFESLSSGLEDMKELYNSGKVGVDEFREFVQLMTNTDLSTSSIDDIVSMYEKGIGTMERFFTGNADGLNNFINTVIEVNNRLGETWVTYDELGNIKFDFGVGGDSELAEAISNMTDLQMSTEQVQILLRGLEAYGWDINLNSVLSDVELVKTNFEKLADKVKEVTGNSYSIDFDTEDVDILDKEIGDITNLIKDMYNSDGELNVKFNEEDLSTASDALSDLILQKESLSGSLIFTIDSTAVDDDLHRVLGKIQEFMTANSLLEALVKVGADTTDAQARVEELRNELISPDTSIEIAAALKLNGRSAEGLVESIDNITPEMLVEAGLDRSEIDQFINEDKDSDGTVYYSVDDSAVRDFIRVNKDTQARVYYTPVTDAVTNYINSLQDIHRNVVYSVTAKGKSNVSGTAFRSGTWGSKRGGTALVGEEGTELLVRDGRFQTIGEDGAEFIKYKKNDIIFNADQTAQLLNDGRITKGKKRGRSFLSGTAFSSGYGGYIRGHGSVTNSNDDSNSYSSGSSDSVAEESKGIIDWIEILFKRVERWIGILKNRMEDVYNSWEDRDWSVKQSIKETTKEIKLQQRAADRYRQEAESVDLSEHLKQLTRDGTINIREYDSDTVSKIQEYQKWYDLYLDCTDAVDDLNRSLKDLYKQKFDNIITKWNNKIQQLSDSQEHLNSIVKQRTDAASDYVGFSNSRVASYQNIGTYKQIIDTEEEMYSQRLQEMKELKREFNSLVSNGIIQEGTEGYSNLLSQIADVQKELDSLNETRISDLNNLAEEYRNIFDTFIDEWESRIAAQEQIIQSLNNNISLAKTKGYITSLDNYVELMQNTAAIIGNKKAEQINLNYSLENAIKSGSIKKYSKQYYDMLKKIKEIDNEIQELSENILENWNNIRDIKWSYFDYFEEKISNITEETAFLLNLLDNYSLYDDRGQFNENGYTALGMYATNYNVLMSQARDYSQEIQATLEEMANSPARTDLIAHYEELIDKQRESIKAAEQQKQSIKKLVSDGMKIELDNLKELINTYNDALSSEKDLYDYQKNITKQTSEISNLRKQLMAYQNDASEETQLKLQKIQVDLNNAQEKLQETEYEHFISEQKKLLDDMYNEYSDILNARLDNIDLLIEDMITEANDNTNVIADNLRAISDKVGYDLSNELQNIWNNNSQLNAVQSYTQSLDQQLTTTNNVLLGILNSVEELIKNSAQGIGSSANNWSNSHIINGYSDKYSFVTNGYGFASGTKRVNTNQIAWTQERGTEYIIRPSDGAILTPLRAGDSVLNQRASANIFDFANDPTQFIKDSLTASSNGGNINNRSLNTMQSINLENVNFNLPNVTNYNEFIAAMQQDKKFEKFIRSISTDRIFGGSSIKKYNL